MAKFPYGKILTFEGTNGFKLIEGTTIARYREWPKVVDGYHGLTRSSEQHRDSG
jgi:hypothetical protein